MAEFTDRVSQQEGFSCYNRGSTIKRFWRSNLHPGLQKLFPFWFINIPYDEIGGARSPKSSIGLVKQTHKGHFDCRADVSSERTYRTACRRKAGGLWPGLRTGVSYTSYYELRILAPKSCFCLYLARIFNVFRGILVKYPNSKDRSAICECFCSKSRYFEGLRRVCRFIQSIFIHKPVISKHRGPYESLLPFN